MRALVVLRALRHGPGNGPVRDGQAHLRSVCVLNICTRSASQPVSWRDQYCRCRSSAAGLERSLLRGAEQTATIPNPSRTRPQTTHNTQPTVVPFIRRGGFDSSMLDRSSRGVHGTGSDQVVGLLAALGSWLLALFADGRCCCLGGSATCEVKKDAEEGANKHGVSRVSCACFHLMRPRHRPNVGGVWPNTADSKRSQQEECRSRRR